MSYECPAVMKGTRAAECHGTPPTAFFCQGDGNLTGGSRYLSAVDGAQRLQSTLREDYANELQASAHMLPEHAQPLRHACASAETKLASGK